MDSRKAGQQLFVMSLALKMLEVVLETPERIEREADGDLNEWAHQYIALKSIEDLGEDASDQAIGVYIQGIRRTLKELLAELTTELRKVDSGG